jgi:hypothetical protein
MARRAVCPTTVRLAKPLTTMAISVCFCAWQDNVAVTWNCPRALAIRLTVATTDVCVAVVALVLLIMLASAVSVAWLACRTIPDCVSTGVAVSAVSYTHLRAHETLA